MSTYSYSRTRKKRVNGKNIAMAIFGVSLIIFGVAGGKAYFINKKFNKTEQAITKVEQEKVQLENKLNKLEQEATNLEVKSEELQKILWRFEPIVIPDSMK